MFTDGLKGKAANYIPERFQKMNITVYVKLNILRFN
jgi:hypothetical protein